MDGVVALLNVVGWGLLVLGGLIVFARLERALNDFIAALFAMVIAVLERIVKGLDRLRAVLVAAAQRLRGMLTDPPAPVEAPAGGDGAPPAPAPRSGRVRMPTFDPNLVAPVLYAVCAVLLLAGDVYLAVLRGGSMFGFDVSEGFAARTELQTLASLLYIVCGIVFAALLFDVVRIGNLRSPFSTASRRARRLMAATALAGLLASAALGGIQQLWGQRAVEGFRDPALSDAYALGIIPLATIAAGLAVVGALHAPRVLLYVAALLLNPPASLLRWNADTLNSLIDESRKALDKGLTLVGTPGSTVWDWLCDFEFAERIHLHPIRDRGSAVPVVDVTADVPLVQEGALATSS